MFIASIQQCVTNLMKNVAIYQHRDVHSCKGSDNLDTKPSLQEERLRSRGTENEDSIKKRLAAANAELEYGQ